MSQAKMEEFGKDYDRDQWNTVKIGDLGEIITGSTPATKDEDNYGGRIPFIRVSAFSDNPFIEETEKKITEKGLEEVKNRELGPNSIMVSCIGNGLGKTAITTERCVTNQQINSVVPNENHDAWFLYYKLSSIQDKFQQYAGGSAQPILSKTRFSEIEIEIPPKGEQEKIGDVLSGFDKKIRVNNRINQILEEMAQAVFKSWFVDFEPYDEFKDSELGEIPEAFEVTTLDKIMEIVLGGTPDSEVDRYWNGNLTWAKAKDVSNEDDVIITQTEKSITKEGLEESSTEIAPEDSTIITARGTVGELAMPSHNIAINQSCYALVANRKQDNFFLFFLMKALMDDLMSRTHGTVFDTVKMQTLREQKIILPPKGERNRFDSVSKDIISLVKNNKEESINLKDIRDTLLPKLMSGEIRVGGDGA